MNYINTLHNQAMEFADLAFFEEQKNGKSSNFYTYTSKAFELEKQVALNFKGIDEKEPNRSILLKSAIYLAFDMNNLDEVEQLIYITLSGTKVPLSIKLELVELLEEIKLIKINSNQNNLSKIAISQNTTIHNIHFKNGNGINKGIIDTEILSEVLLTYQKLRIEIAKSIYPNKNKKEIDQIALTEIIVNKAASFSVFLRPKKSGQIGIFDTENIYEISDRLELLLSKIGDIELLKNDVHLTKNEMNTLKKLLDSIAKKEIQIDFNSYFIGKGERHKYSINKNYSEQILKNICQLTYNKTDIIELEGGFLMLNLKTKKFTFLTKVKEEIKGDYAKVVYNEITKISFESNYKIKIYKYEQKEIGKNLPDYRYEIIEINEL